MKNNRLSLLLVLVLLNVLVSCKTYDSTADKTVEFIWEYAGKHQNGFTLNIKTNQPVTSGIAVSYIETQNSFGKESLYKVVEHSMKHESIVGGWLNKKDSLYYFDSNKVFPDSLLNLAIKFALVNKQAAVYDITNDSTIWISDFKE